MRRFRWTALGVLAVVALIVLWFPGSLSAATGSAGPGLVGPTRGSPTHSAPGAAPLVHPASLRAPVASAAGPRPFAPSPSAWNNSADCQHRAAAYQQYYGTQVPADVVHTEQNPCYIGHDEPGMNFISNASYAGSRVQFAVHLPLGGTNTGSAFSTFWVGMWLAGVSCSYRGQSYLEVQLNPPYNAIGLTPNANWTVQAPVWDLVPAGSCDPQCQNDTAFQTIGGLNFCEDDAAISGVGTYTPTGWGNFAPGDALLLSLVGKYGGATGLTVYLNDTTHPLSSLTWTYSALVTANHQPLTPFYNSSGWTEGGWGYGLNVEATWENCPEPAAQPLPTSCNSYDAPAVSAVGVPTITSASYWNATSQSYSNPYPWFATTSSAGGCSGFAAPCEDFTQYGGTGSYPYWTLHAWAGKSWWMYGDTYPNEVSTYGGAAAQFNPLGFVPVYTDPTAVFSVRNTSIGNTFFLVASVADPNGVLAVQFGSYFCSASSTPSVRTASGTLAVTTYDTANEGNWSGSFSTGTYKGTLYYWVKAESSSGVWSNPVYGSASIAGVTSCSFTAPVAPTFALANVTSVGGGYRLNWSDPSAGITDYRVWYTGPNATGNLTTKSFDAGAARSVILPIGVDNKSFNLTIVATSASGLASPNSSKVAAPNTLVTLSAKLTGPTSTVFWYGRATATFSANATGGKGPFTYTVVFGDGSSTVVNSSAKGISVVHSYVGYFGDARASVSISDSVGDRAASPRQMIQVWATPTGAVQYLAAGDGAVNISWAPPLSPAAPVTYYTVYYTENPLWAFALTSTWPYNYTPYGLKLWNTTHVWLQLSVPNGVTLWAQVCAWNLFGEGQLPAGTPTLVGTPAPLVLGPILGAPGGPAPFSDSFSTFVTNGTNDQISSAVYSTGTSFVAAAVNVASTGVYLNGTLNFPSPGLHTVVLHVSDQFSDVGITLSQVYVTPGSGPTVTLTPPTANGWFGWAGAKVSLGSLATGTPGPYEYDWVFGDGNVGFGENVSHAFAVSGNYTLSLTVTDNTTGGVSTRTQPIQIFALPLVGISAAPGPDGPLSWRFTALLNGGSGPAKVTWSYGDGSVGTGTTVTHDYVAAGTYPVNATSTDPSGKTASTTFTLTLAAPPAPTTSGTFLGVGASTFGTLAIALALLAVIFLLGMVYFWSRSRRPPIVMSPEPTKDLVKSEP